MQKVIHFISGLPRSGSTLLAASLRQNPRFHAGISSPVASLFMALQAAMSRRNEAAVFIDEFIATGNPYLFGGASAVTRRRMWLGRLEQQRFGSS
jgi:hypothetical protein